jgi:hypothetical protein
MDTYILKLIVTKVVNKFTSSYETQLFVTLFSGIRRWILFHLIRL